jgi:hypothetical protein
MATGYSIALLRKVKAADPKAIGVKLGRYCIDNDIPVSSVAEEFGVSRAAVYCWFAGDYAPNKAHHDRIIKFISE